MKKVLSLIVGVLVISAFAVACADIAPMAPDEALEPSMAKVDTAHGNSKYFSAGGFQLSNDPYPGYFQSYNLFLRDYKFTPGDDITSLQVWTEDPSESCFDEVELANKDYHWSMGGGWVKAETACGPVEVTWHRTSEVAKGSWNEWNCSPPEGEFPYHSVGHGRHADAVASGMVGWLEIPLMGTTVEINSAHIHHGILNITGCGGRPFPGTSRS